jgi:hypothetical protein
MSKPTWGKAALRAHRIVDGEVVVVSRPSKGRELHTASVSDDGIIAGCLLFDRSGRCVTEPGVNVRLPDCRAGYDEVEELLAVQSNRLRRRTADKTAAIEAKKLESAIAEAEAELFRAANLLASHDGGRDALRRLVDWLDSGGCSLDQRSQQAVLTLLAVAWGGYAGTALDVMREVLGE